MGKLDKRLTRHNSKKGAQYRAYDRVDKEACCSTPPPNAPSWAVKPTTLLEEITPTIPSPNTSTPRQGRSTPRQAQTTPRQAHTTPKQAQTTPRQAQTTPRTTPQQTVQLVRSTPQHTNWKDPRKSVDTPRRVSPTLVLSDTTNRRELFPTTHEFDEDIPVDQNDQTSSSASEFCLDDEV